MSPPFLESSLQRKPVPGFEGLYEVTRRGDVYSCRLGRFIKASERQAGRVFVQVQIDRKKRRVSVADAVADAFLSPQDKAQIIASVPDLLSLSYEQVEAHRRVAVLARQHYVVSGAILSVLCRARAEAA